MSVSSGISSIKPSINTGSSGAKLTGVGVAKARNASDEKNSTTSETTDSTDSTTKPKTTTSQAQSSSTASNSAVNKTSGNSFSDLTQKAMDQANSNIGNAQSLAQPAQQQMDPSMMAALMGGMGNKSSQEKPSETPRSSQAASTETKELASLRNELKSLKELASRSNNTETKENVSKKETSEGRSPEELAKALEVVIS